MKALQLFFSILLSSLFAGELFAQGIRIIDCKGNTKALRQQTQELGLKNSVKIEVIGASGIAAETGILKLTSKSGEVLKATIFNGIAEFPEVSPGVWMLGSEQPGLFFSSIALSDPIVLPFWQQVGNTLGQAGKIAIVTGAIVGGAVLVNEANNGSGSGGDDSVQPPSGSNGCPACNPDVNAPSIPAFD